MRTATGRYLAYPWQRYPVAYQDEAARQTIEMQDRFIAHPYVPEPSPPCSVCGKDNIFCWHPKRPEKAICATCCDKSEDGHDFRYERGDGYLCQNCGDQPSHEWYADRASDW